ncbi:class II fructose-bisphosphate aldolase [Aestuariispira ectoiniformans]|uniref:class II fructose-bisphosphate aldolase n=1 Tax=Aestuariispira ectoiniformans TaxID=2775080 RepID=UPI00223A967E|nr:class II fructose-bisphosphate aldolase [Aestuariispira ectoiniformans]
MATLKPGVVYGDSYLELLKRCKEGKYALPGVNIVGTNSLNAVLESAARNESDVIIQMSNGGAQFFAGQGFPDSAEAKVLGAVSAAHHVHLLAEYYGVCVVLHTDHANRKLVPWVDGMIEHGRHYFEQHGRPLFTSHMLDLSEETLEDNITECERVLEKMAPLKMSLEIELGVTGGEEDGVGSDEDIHDNPKLYTQPEDVLQAYDRLSQIGHFSIAASFGNVHGVYKPGNVRLRPEILKNSQALVSQTHSLGDNPLDLVFHGGSGSEKEKIHEAIDYGVFKMNIDTDTQFAFARAIGAYVDTHPKAFKYQVDPETDEPYKKLYDPRKWLRAAELSMVERLDEAFADLRATGKSLAKN